jgi:very-short-patch-repair endonuclease
MKNQRAGQVPRARSLRAETTNAERTLWRHLRNRQLEGVKFQRQHPVGPYVTDFCCLESALFIELDGTQHSDRAEADERRTICLNQQGFRVLRFWNPDALRDVESIVETIRAEIVATTPHPTLSPQAGRADTGASANMLSTKP